MRSPSHQFEDKEAHTPGVFEAVDAADVRVAERGEHLGLALEPREVLGIFGEALRQNLDRHLAAQLRVARAIDLAHAARAERRDDLVRTERGSICEGHECLTLHFPALAVPSP